MLEGSGWSGPSKGIQNHQQTHGALNESSCTFVAKFVVSLLFFLSGLTTIEATGLSTKRMQSSATGVYRYNVCNGLAEQLLSHAAHIAIALQQHKSVEIPNYFIVNDEHQGDEDVLPNASNSIPFSAAFDVPYLFQHLQQGLGIRQVELVTFDLTKPQIPCAGTASVNQADPKLLMSVLRAFRPSPPVQSLIRNITSTLETDEPEMGAPLSADNVNRKPRVDGICLHHPDGKSWHNHCAMWSSISDGQDHCLGVVKRRFVESLSSRGLTATTTTTGDKKIRVYYCGDRDISSTLRSIPYEVISQKDVVTAQVVHTIASMPANTTGEMVSKGMTTPIQLEAETSGQPESSIPGFRALIDFYVCSNLTHFIGNSRSTFSAIQIALRQGDGAYWYNSQNIPMGGIWHDAFPIPIVYTYTETSPSFAKHLMQVSILSARRHMPDNPIHILYHGTDDRIFQSWLHEHGVIIHSHDPKWREELNQLKQSGHPTATSLHWSKSFAALQRIDIPRYIDHEYCLHLDADTLVFQPFSLPDFGSKMFNIAMSSAGDPANGPLHFGAMFINIPRMRQTYHDFLEFVLHRGHSKQFEHASLSDQGPYLNFYGEEVQLLPRIFNFKPYWKFLTDKEQELGPFVVHFHGAKPHDYMNYIMAGGCDETKVGFCHNGTLCRAIQQFSITSLSVDATEYCDTGFKNDLVKAAACHDVLRALASPQEECRDFPGLVRQALARRSAVMNRAKISQPDIHMYQGTVLGSRPVVVMALATILQILRFGHQWQRYRNKGRYNR